ncbi:MAG: fused MFS/spermidine synthase [Gemmatimonadales bacterium]|nr:fused MFS/spermidine synthase [Gemmatimonadales bacterium]
MKTWLAFLCFFVTGFTGLVYEIAWIRKASLVIGSTTEAMSTVLGIFFAGLALGSWLFGRYARNLDQPIRLYALLEVAVAALALVSLRAFEWVDTLYAGIYQNALQAVVETDGLTWLSAGPAATWARIGLVALILLPPTILMGGTLPLFCRQFVVSRDRIASRIGILYGINTLGAATGALAAGFLLLPSLGITGAVALSAGLNLLVGLVAILLRFQAVTKPIQAPVSEVRGSTAPHTDPNRPLRLISGLFFMTGLVAVAAEILWVRFLALLIRNSIYTYSITLAVVLFGIVLGSLLASRLGDREQTGKPGLGTWFAFLQIGSALTILVLMFLPVEFWRGLGQGLTPFFFLMLLPAIFSGASFPLANRLVLNDPRMASVRVGRMTALNTVGGISGSLLAGFLLLPSFGLATGTIIITGLGLAAGLVALFLLEPGFGRGNLMTRATAGALALGIWILVPITAGSRLPADYLGKSGQLIDFAEGRCTTLAAVRSEDQTTLQINNLWQGSSLKGHQIMAAHVPSLLHPDPQKVLVIGVGVGQTAGRFLLHDVDRLDCVDIERDIFPFIVRHFDSDWMTDPRVQLIPDDGRTYMAHCPESYDIISVEVGQVFRPGVDVFYTREFYAAAAERLNPGGLVAQFVSLSFFQQPEFASVLATFLDVFPHAVLWYNTQELLLIGGRDSQPKLDLKRLTDALKDKALHRDLAWSHWGGSGFFLNQPGTLLGGFLTGSEGLARLATGGSLYNDDHPALAYATTGVQPGDRLEKQLVPLLKAVLAPFELVVENFPPGIDPSESKVMKLAAETRHWNLGDVLASGLLGQVTDQQSQLDLRATLSLLRKALEQNPHSRLALFNSGKAFLLAGRMEQAEPLLAQAVKLRPDLGMGRRELGLVLLQTDRPAEALGHLEAAVSALPEDFASHNYLGTALAITGNLPRAIAEFERALEIQPGEASVLANLRRARQGLGNR